MVEEQVRLTGEVLREPVRFAKGDTLTLEQVHLSPEEAGTFSSDITSLDGALLSIHFFEEGTWHGVEGSAVMVAPGVAVSARHVVEPRWPKIRDRELKILAIGPTKSGLLIWQVREMVPVGETDLLVLLIELASVPPPDLKFRVARASTRAPGKGELVSMVGFHATVAGRREGILSYEVEALTGTATVGAVHHDGRDAAMLPFPCFEIQCGARGGMSGGPVFDLAGNLIGLVCSSIHSEDDAGPSYGSLLWPALAQPIHPWWPERCVRPVRLMNGPIEGREALKVESLEGREAVHYEPWPPEKDAHHSGDSAGPGFKS